MSLLYYILFIIQYVYINIFIYYILLYYYIIYIYNIKYYIYLGKKIEETVWHMANQLKIFFSIHFPLLPRNTSLHHMLIFLFIVFLLLPFWHFFQIMQKKKTYGINFLSLSLRFHFIISRFPHTRTVTIFSLSNLLLSS